MIKRLPDRNTKPEEPHKARGNGILASELGRGGKFFFWRKYSAFDSQTLGRHGFVDTSKLGMQAPEHRRLGGDHSGPRRKDGVANGPAEKRRALNDSAVLPHKCSDALPSASCDGTKYHLDPQAYRDAKRRLRKAVAEHYRCVGIMLFLRRLASERPGRGESRACCYLVFVVANAVLICGMYLQRPRGLKQLQSEPPFLPSRQALHVDFKFPPSDLHLTFGLSSVLFLDMPMIS